MKIQSPLTFLFVSGAWHGAWCWQKVRLQLTQAGHRVIAPDLPGLGLDRTPQAEVTFADAVDRVLDLVARSKEPVVLIGHSLGGMVISQVAEELPEKIRWLVYVTALLPQDGESAMNLIDPASPVNACVEVDTISMRLRYDAAFPFFYPDCSLADRQIARRLLRPQALLPMQTPVTLSERFANVPRAYIACSQDRVLTLAQQEQLYTRTTCRQIHMLESGHSPFFSVPDQLIGCLVKIAASDPEIL